ncbi:MAG: ABC transporter ATP-binding protein [Pedosphaera sp.]|nr:ABC transporter ATP-binding protein [Pedosphaera sp.]
MGHLRNFFELLNLVRRLRGHMRPGRGLVVAAFFTTQLAAVLEVFGVALLVPLIDLLLSAEGAKSGRPVKGLFDFAGRVQHMFPGHSLTFYIGIFCAFIALVVLVKAQVQLMSLRLIARLLMRIVRNLRTDLFVQLQQMDLGVLEARKSGEIASAFTSTIQQSSMAIENLVLMVLRLTVAMAYLIAAVSQSWQVAAGLALVVFVVAFSASLLHRRLKRIGIEVVHNYRMLAGQISEATAGIRVIRATGAQAHTTAAFEKANDVLSTAEEAGRSANSSILPLAESMGMFGSMIVVVVAYHWLIAPKYIEPSALMVIGMMLIRTLPVLNQLMTHYSMATFAFGSLRELERWLLEPRFPWKPFGTEVFGGVREQIRFENLCYSYPNGREAIRNVSFSIPAGKRVALVGSSGSGKTTLASLLLRLRAPSSGCIRVDGRDYWEFSPESWHHNLALVEQEPFLFHDTIAHNIAYGLLNATLAEIHAALDTAYLSEMIASLPLGVDTVVGERGAMLSGGQRQRLAIARAVIRNPRLLILDEATSALDSASEQEVQRALENATAGRTVVVIAHRLSTVRNVDWIVVLDQGRLIEQGTWKELVAANRSFARLVRLNQLRSEPET